MRMITRLLLLLFASTTLILTLSSCSQRKITGTVKLDSQKTIFEPIENANLSLTVVGSRQLVSGIDDSITFKLTNNGQAIRIEEWYEKEIDNLIISYQDWLPNTEEPHPLKWKTLPIIMIDRTRYPLDLPASASVLIRAGLPFLEGLKVTPGKERRFFIRATLNLRSVKANSKVYGIAVL